MDDTRSGASPEALKEHYDTGNPFFSAWLDSSLTYSAAMWSDDPGEQLEAAQVRKLEHHIEAARATNKARVLDVGCGWGSMLERLTRDHGVDRAVGLTLSDEQAAWIRARGLQGVEVKLEDWRDHEPEAPYDAIISIGALEHFVKPSDSPEVRCRTYRQFFERCRDLMAPGGRLTIQTSAYATGGFVTGAIADIFPESDLPRLPQLVEAAEGILEVVSLRNDRMDYARTCAAWRQRLKANSEAAIAATDLPTFKRYNRFLAAAAKGFEYRVFMLLRMTLAKPDLAWELDGPNG